MTNKLTQFQHNQQKRDTSRAVFDGLMNGIRKRKEPARDPDKRKQEIHCHACNGYVQFEIDISWDGNYTIPCPKCGHDHYRIVRNGIITDQRWKSSGAVYQTVSSLYYTNISSSASTTGYSTASYYSITYT